MVRPNQLKHYYFKNTALSYNSNDSPLAGPHWESGSKNAFTSIKQFAERAPGFAAYEATATVFTGSIKRIFTWETWAGAFYLFVCETYTGHSVVWKLKVGTDAAFVKIYDDINTTEPWDFCVSNNKVYMSNGNEAWCYEGSGTTIRPWGIGTFPMVGTAGPPDYSRGRPVVTVSASAGTMDATVGYRYVYTYANSSTFHQSSASNPSIATGAFTDKLKTTITGIRSTDAQVDKIHIFRTTDGGGGIYFEIPTSPIANPAAPGSSIVISAVTVGATTTITTATAHGFTSLDVVTISNVANTTVRPPGRGAPPQVNGTWVVTVTDGTHFTIPVTTTGWTFTVSSESAAVEGGYWTVDDDALDIELSSARAPMGMDNGNNIDNYYIPSGINDPPKAMGNGPGLGPVWFANRIWYFKDDRLHYSGWEEITEIGLEEECIPPTNFMVFSQAIQGLASNDECLLVFTASQIWKITGDTLINFRRDPLFSNLGCRNRACIARFGRSIAWFDTGHTLRITDGFTQKELGIDIRPDLASVSPTTACLSFYSNGTAHLLCLLDTTGGKMYVYDLDLEQWMPPWEHVGASTALWWGEISAGTPALLLGSPGKKLLKLTPAAYLFDGATYAGELRGSLLELVPPDQPARIATPQVITLERNSVALSDVLELRDDNTDNGTYTSDLAKLATVGTISPPLRQTGANIIEEWFGTEQTACKRISPKFTWAAASTNWILYSFSVGFYENT